MKKCELCGEIFKEFDEVVLVNERDYFHEAGVALSPINTLFLKIQEMPIMTTL